MVGCGDLRSSSNGHNGFPLTPSDKHRGFGSLRIRMNFSFSIDSTSPAVLLDHKIFPSLSGLAWLRKCQVLVAKGWI
jgi:hypothetical protein